MPLQNIDYGDPLWSSTVHEIRHDVYHLPEYCLAEAQARKTSSHAFLVAEGEDILFVPYLRRQCSDLSTDLDNESFDIVSPYGYSGVLLNKNAERNRDFIDSAIDEIRREMIRQNINSAFFRLHPILNNQFNINSDFAKTVIQGKSVSIDLTLSESELWTATRKGHRSSINKCERLGVTTVFLPLQENIHKFMDVYEETMNRVEARQSYYFDETYFNNLAALGEHVHLAVAYVDQRLASACIFFESCGVVQAHLCGTKNEFLPYSPLMQIIDHARKRYKRRGNEYLHLGAGYQGNTGDPIFNFKSGFSQQRFDFSALCIIGEADQYYQLVQRRARELDVSTDELLNSEFFPSYRAARFVEKAAKDTDTPG